MTNKEIAERGRRILAQTDRNADDKHRELVELFNQLDPSRPEPDTVVWWRFKHHETYRTGLVADGGDGVIDSEQEFHEWMDIEYKPARIAGPMQKIVDIPPVSEWPESAVRLVFWPKFYNSAVAAIGHVDEITITRAEAEHMEAAR